MADRTATERQQRRFLHTGSKRWRAIREQVLAGEPLCRDCKRMGRITPAIEVDHVSGDTADNRPENLAPLCKSCHSHRTACAMAGVPVKGCDVDGWPLDDRHPWNLARSDAENRQSGDSSGTCAPLSFIAKRDPE